MPRGFIISSGSKLLVKFSKQVEENQMSDLVSSCCSSLTIKMADSSPEKYGRVLQRVAGCGSVALLTSASAPPSGAREVLARQRFSLPAVLNSDG